ncbi:MAG: aspartyl protease [Oscillatoria sp. PMC 1051.18]|nr:aspartyl protease [Oscillatoria sp. PMC 1050.18]MEC5028452.1 aspartyl protease [Oscillatoria sp. PMC 1051.18]
MIQGYFGNNGELYFEIELVTADREIIAVDALLDTGFTDWLAMDAQDATSLGWIFVRERDMRTARGESKFNLYQGNVIFDNEELTIPVLGGFEITEFLIGLPWLENRRLIADRQAGVLTLETND